MPKYFSNGGWEGDYEYWTPEWEVPLYQTIDVPDHVASFTGLLDSNGNFILREPRPIGFGRDLD